MHTLYWSQRVAVEALKFGVRKVVPKSDKATLLTAVREILESESANASSVALAPAVVAGGAMTLSSVSAGSTAERHESRSDSAASDECAPKA